METSENIRGARACFGRPAAQATLRGILHSCTARVMILDPAETPVIEAPSECLIQWERFTTPDTENPQNNVHLERLQQEKTVLFIKSGTWTKSSDFIYEILYFQLLYVLIGHPTIDNIRERVHIYFDEMGNMAPMPNLYMFLAVCRKYDVDCTMSFQSAEQIKSVYGGDWETVTGNCDTMIYLCGGATLDTSKYISARLGDTTISSTPATKNFISKIIGGRWAKADPPTTMPRYQPKISPDEIAQFDKNQCIVQVRSEAPVIAPKIRKS